MKYPIRLIIFGSESVGKTSYVQYLLNKVLHLDFNELIRSETPFIGPILYINEFKKNSKISLIIFDMPGVKKIFKVKGTDILVYGGSLFHKLFEPGQVSYVGVIYVCDYTNPDSLSVLEQFIELIKQLTSIKLPRILVSTKHDIKGKSEKKIQEFIKKHRFDNYFRTSSFTGENIKISFNNIISQIINS